MALCHAIHYCARQDWLILHIPDGKDRGVFFFVPAGLYPGLQPESLTSIVEAASHLAFVCSPVPLSIPAASIPTPRFSNECS